MGQIDDSRERAVARPHSHIFTVRLWKQEVAGGAEYRGSVREATSGAFRNFRDWPELVAFMVDRIEDEASARSGHS
jgi:hypothetical protein